MLDSHFTLSRLPAQPASFQDDNQYHRISPRFQQRQYYKGALIQNAEPTGNQAAQQRVAAQFGPETDVSSSQINFQAMSDQVVQMLQENTMLIQNQIISNPQMLENIDLRQQVDRLQGSIGGDVAPIQQIQALNQQTIQQQNLIIQYQRAVKKLTSEIRRLKDAEGAHGDVQRASAVGIAQCQTEFEHVDDQKLLLSSNNALRDNNDQLRRENDELRQRLNEANALRISTADNAQQKEAEKQEEIVQSGNLATAQLAEENQQLRSQVATLEEREKSWQAAQDIIERLNSQLETTCAGHDDIVTRFKAKIQVLEQQLAAGGVKDILAPPTAFIEFFLRNRLDPVDEARIGQRFSAILLHCRNLQYYSNQLRNSCQYFSDQAKFLYTKLWRFQQLVAGNRWALRTEMAAVLADVEPSLRKRIESVLEKY